jgi:curli production assembly/transport component CsgE
MSIFNRGAVRAALAAFCVACTAGVVADDSDAIDRGALSETGRLPLELSAGFIIDRTITHFGAEFVRHFSQAWREQGSNVESADLTLVERPSARWGSIVYVEYNSRPEARVILYAGRSATIKPLAEQTARYMANRIADQRLAGLLLHDPDLGKPGL